MKLALFMVAFSTSAAYAGPVALEIESCPALTAGALSETLALELAHDQVALVDGPAESRLEVRCLEGVALVAVLARLGGRQEAELIDLRDVSPDQRVRALALTLAERYRAWVAGPPDSSAPPPKTDTLAPAPTTAVVSGSPSENDPAPIALEATTRLSSGLALTTWPSSLWLWGPRVDFKRPFTHTFGLHLALEAGFANTSTDPGEVSTWSLGATFGLELGSTHTGFAWAVGPRVQVAALGFSGSGASEGRAGESGIAPIVAVGLGADLEVVVSEGWFVGLGVELMMTALGARATAPEGTVLEATGLRLGASLGVGHRW